MSKDSERPEISFMGLPKLASASIAIAAYVVCSIGCVYANKWLLTYVGTCDGFIPLVQQLIGSVFVRATVYITGFTGIGSDNQNSSSEKTIQDGQQNESLFKRFWNRYKYIWPASVCFSSTIVLNNACLSSAKLSTYSVAKSTTLIWNVLFQFIFLRIKLPVSTIFSCFLIITGVAVGSLDTNTLAPLAIIAGCSSSIFQALYNTCIARALPKINNDTSEALVRNQELSSMLLVIYIIVSKELVNLFMFSPCFDLSSPDFLSCWGVFLLTTALAAGLNKFTFMVIGLTEPSTFSVVGFAKASLQTAGGWLIYKDPISIESVTSVILTLSGSLIYGITRSKKKESKKEQVEEIRRLTRCSAASVGDIDVAASPGDEAEVNKLTSNDEKQKLIASKV
ncbi:fucose translocator with 8 transmembrane domains [Cryptosporidium sp. chipmunk genotype I]|uniref:fucose translocator with 8 transmembrane domains n=1 Tax=Cryptosporidium sp. chipmunk genotype I TaxID=1280935 RepID=UPI00351AA2DF|nr:fucose translocator with 8 transmembrane domains [Cryptosporidium sp. chipmunk genotype I]